MPRCLFFPYAHTIDRRRAQTTCDAADGCPYSLLQRPATGLAHRSPCSPCCRRRRRLLARIRGHESRNLRGDSRQVTRGRIRSATHASSARYSPRGIPLIFFDQQVLKDSRVESAKGEYIRARGVVASYKNKYTGREELQIMVTLPAQVEIEVIPPEPAAELPPAPARAEASPEPAPEPFQDEGDVPPDDHSEALPAESPEFETADPPAR